MWDTEKLGPRKKVQLAIDQTKHGKAPGAD